MKQAFLSLLLIASQALAAPSRFDDVRVGTSVTIGSQSAANSKALLDVSSTTKGVLLPRMTTTQRDNISSPTTGLLIFNTTTGTYQSYNGSSWEAMSAATAITSLTGDVSASGPGAAAATVNQVGGYSAANVAAGATLANAATNANTSSAIVKRDGSGNFSAGTITASLTGNTTGTHTGDVSDAATLTTVDQGSTPANPAAGKTKLYTKSSDGKLYKLTSGGVETAIGSGSGQGGINYFVTSTSSDSSDLEVSVGGWSAYADAAATSPVDGTGGSPTLTCTRSTSSPLRGSGSLLITKAASNLQGEGCAASFTIDSADLAKSMTVSFDYTVASGTYDAGSDTTDSDLTAWVYGPTDGTPTLTQLAPYKVLGATSGTSMRFISRFQTAATGTVYRLILHEAKTGASAYTVKVDNLSVGPESKSFGPPVVDATAFTPTGSWVANSTYTGWWRRVGDFAEISVLVSTSGAPTSADLSINLPSGFTIDTSKGSYAALSTVLDGGGHVLDGGVALYDVVPVYSSTTAVILRVKVASGTYTSTSTINQALPITFGSGDAVGVTFRVPILGWSSTVAMSNDSDTRVVAAGYYGTSDTSIAASTEETIPYSTKLVDTHNSYSAGVYTVPASGVYRISANASSIDASGLAIARQLNIYKNASIIGSGGQHIAASGTSIRHSVDATAAFAAGDTITVKYSNAYAGGAATIANSQETNLQIERLAGPSQIASTESVQARYSSNAAQTINASSVAEAVDFEDKDYDSHGACTTGASWKCTAPVSGVYTVCANTLWSSSAVFTSGTRRELYLTKNGHTTGEIVSLLGLVQSQASTSDFVNTGGCADVRLLSGDYVGVIAVNGEGSTRDLVSTSSNVWATFKRVGNY